MLGSIVSSTVVVRVCAPGGGLGVGESDTSLSTAADKAKYVVRSLNFVEFLHDSL